MENSNLREPTQNQEFTSGSSKGGKKRRGKSRKSKMPERGMNVAALENLRLKGEYGTGYLHALQGLPYYPAFTQEHMAGHHVFPSPQMSARPSYPRLGYFQKLLYYGVEEPELGNISYGDPRFNAPSSWIIPSGGAMFQNQQLVQPTLTRNFIDQLADCEASHKWRRLGRSQNAQTSQAQEVDQADLELKL